MRLTDYQQRVLRAVEALYASWPRPDHWVGATVVGTEVYGDYVSLAERRSIARALAVLADAGHLERITSGGFTLGYRPKDA